MDVVAVANWICQALKPCDEWEEMIDLASAKSHKGTSDCCSVSILHSLGVQPWIADNSSSHRPQVLRD